MEHQYNMQIKWTGNKGSGTSSYQDYERSHTISIPNKGDLLASSDTVFRGDSSKHNPEDLLVASISSCHMLWYLHLCADAGIIVIDYVDQASGILVVPTGLPGHFQEVTLRPIVTVKSADMIEKALELHKKTHELCFISNSVNFPVNCKAECLSI